MENTEILHDTSVDKTPSHNVDVLIIGSGQAGLCVAYELKKRGFIGYAGNHDRNCGTFIVLDAESGPGGAWQHRWPTLTMGSVNQIADLPQFPVGKVDPNMPSSKFISQYFADYEAEFDLPILHMVTVFSVTHNKTEDLFTVKTTSGIWNARYIVNCTGTWTRPFLPWYPGVDTFRGQQFHTQTYPGADHFWGKRVMIVGGGISALSHLNEVFQEAKKTVWVTRTSPRWRDENFSSSNELSPEAGRAVEQRVRARVKKGLLPLPVVAETGLPENAMVKAMRARGALKRHKLFDRLDAHGAWWGDKHRRLDAIIWATGFRPELRHLAPLGLRSEYGGIAMEGVHARQNPNVFLIGYGSSASTVGARRDARVVAQEILVKIRH
ncbi:NAD(P)-binding domain-containing protein [Arcanobacterium ihumii]|uniref:NAD(P)-binding domain-containing protein n=1 Tax=Arcanobacterium ihumii TaxID=2138162 RepID=UPI000F5202FD|nr:NAD(P)-binding domain-containing protein [Arcanobacterium ihumii]